MLRRFALIVLLLGAVSARAAGLQVTPVLVELSAAEPRTTVLVKNIAPGAVRIEVTASAWEQAPDGEMRLTPAPEIVVYPPLLTLAPQEERKVRISSTAEFGTTERSYRLFLRELPPAEKPSDQTAVRFLTRIGVPVFMLPARPELRAEIAGAAVHGGKLALTVKNTGNTRLSPAQVTIEGIGADGQRVFSKQESLWYVLAGGERVLDVPLPAEGCRRAREVRVEVPVGDGAVRARVETPGGACGP